MISKWSKRDAALLGVVVIGLAGVVGLARRIDSQKPPGDFNTDKEQLYVNGATVKRISLGFNGLAADWYWMRSLQYIGHKFLNANEDLQLDDLSKLKLTLLAPLLDTATTLDPAFMEPYQYAAVVLPAVNVDEAIRITRKGIAANPSAWQLYQQLGYIYWQQKDFQKASDAYGEGAAITGAPPWMQVMKGKMANEGGSRELAREIYSRMYQEAEAGEVKEMARKRLLQLESFDQRDVLRKVLTTYQSKAGRCPSSWKELEPVFSALRVPLDPAGAPLDPAGTGYVLLTDKCDVDLNPKSEVPYK